MADVRVRMKDGRTFCGPLWTWRPCEDYMVIVDEAAPGRLPLSEMESAIEHGERVGGVPGRPGIALLADTDMLKMAEVQVRVRACCLKHWNEALSEGFSPGDADDPRLYRMNHRPDPNPR